MWGKRICSYDTCRTCYQDFVMTAIVAYHTTVLWGTVFKYRRRFLVAHGAILLTMPFPSRRSVVWLMTLSLYLRVRVHHYKCRDPCISHKLTSLSSVWRKLFGRVTLRLVLVTVRYASWRHHFEWDRNSTDYRRRGRISV